MKEETRNYLIAGLCLAIIVTLLAAALYLEWHTLLYSVAWSLMGYGAYRLLEQSAVGQKMLELIIISPLLLVFASITIGGVVYPLASLLSLSPWLYINNQPICGSAILEHPGAALFVFGIAAFWAVITVCLIVGLKRVWRREHGRR